MSQEVVANLGQLRKAFKDHTTTIETTVNTTISHELLRFYANECGLKAKYLAECRLKDTSEFENHSRIAKKYGHGHDLVLWMDELRIPQASVKRPKIHEPYRFTQLHETLRYGVKPLEEHIEISKSLHTFLKKIL